MGKYLGASENRRADWDLAPLVQVAFILPSKNRMSFSLYFLLYIILSWIMFPAVKTQFDRLGDDQRAVDGAEVAAVKRIWMVPDQEELVVCQGHATLPRRHRSARFVAWFCCRNVLSIDKNESVFRQIWSPRRPKTRFKSGVFGGKISWLTTHFFSRSGT